MIKKSDMEKDAAGLLYGINSIEIAPRALLLAVSVILSVILVSLMITQFRAAQDMAGVSSELINERTEYIRNSDVMQYDGLTVSGADMVNFCIKQLEDTFSGEQPRFKITLKSSSGNSRTYNNYDSAVKLKDPENSEYVNPMSKWMCRVNRNKNGIITEVVFTKK
ncbi:MAG: hypothetical protein IKP88_12430 [Lachnospiraceae bacterium]|nr:hypothetical protein [Lachnospiraceae bacterium]